MKFEQSKSLNNVLYDIRGPVLKEAMKLEEEGYKILKLNIGNPAIFGFDTPDELIHDVIYNLRKAQGYCESKGIFPARKAVMQYYQQKNVQGVEIEDVFMGNGASELINLSLQALLNLDDEVLIPSPDYPLWTASVNLSSGKAVHYICDEESEWYPDIEDIKKKITDRTKAIVVINPNNPTGAVYPKEILEQIVAVAEEKNLIIFADEIYDKILYDGIIHTPLSSIVEKTLVITFNGLSKSYRAAGYRCGWMVISGSKRAAKSYIEGLNLLSSMRLCSNVPSQYAVQAALGGYQSINDLVLDGGRLKEQRDFIYNKLIAIDGITCVKPKGALYIFPKIDTKKFNIKDDEKFILDFLKQEKVLFVHGRGFNWKKPDHFRVVFLPDVETLSVVTDKLEHFLSDYSQ